MATMSYPLQKRKGWGTQFFSELKTTARHEAWP